MLTNYDVVILAAGIEEFPPYEVIPISDGEIECTNNVCEVHITYSENCTQDLQLSSIGVGTSYASGSMDCGDVLWSVDANMSVWTPGLGADALSQDHPVSVVSLANFFIKYDGVDGEIIQHQSRSIEVINSVKKKGKRTMFLSGGLLQLINLTSV